MQKANLKTFFENRFGSSIKLIEFVDDADVVQHQLLIGDLVLTLTNIKDFPVLEFTKVEDLSSPDFKPHHVMSGFDFLNERSKQFIFKHLDSVRHASYTIRIVYVGLWVDSHTVYIEIVAKDTLGSLTAFIRFRLEGNFLCDYDKVPHSYQTVFEFEPDFFEDEV